MDASLRLAAIVENSDDGIISKDLNGVITSWNRAAERMFGYTEAEAIGQSILMLIPDDLRDEEDRILARIRRGIPIEHYETVRQRKDGALLDVSITVSPVRDLQGHIVGASKIARDITERKRQEEALRQTARELQQAKDELEIRVLERTASLREVISHLEEFSYTVSHDLRAPLRAMRVYSQALEEDYEGLLNPHPEALRYLSRISANCIRLDKMVNDFLDFGRISREQMRLEEISLDRVMEIARRNCLEAQPLDAELQISPLGSAIGYEPALIQAFSKLLSNALTFVQPGQPPRIRVWSEPRGEWLRVWVEDNGIGIDPSLQHRLFNVFERLPTNQPYEGTGVGLAIVRKAIERMGGQVGVESDGQNGSRFWVQLRAA